MSTVLLVLAVCFWVACIIIASVGSYGINLYAALTNYFSTLTARNKLTKNNRL